jgi:hypothetical protein
MHHTNVKSTFLNDEYGQGVYVSQPPGFIITDHEDTVLRLYKKLYGLHEAPRAWNAKLD